MKYIVSDPEKIDRALWSDFVMNHAEGNIFQMPGMYDVLRHTPNCEPLALAVIDSNDRIRGILVSSVLSVKGYLMGKLSSRSVVYGGPVLDHDDNEAADLILKEYDRLISGRAIYSQFRNFNLPNNDRAVFSLNRYNFREHLNIILDLGDNEQNLWDGFSRSRKKGIKKAQGGEFTFSFQNGGESIDEFCRLLNNTYKRIKLPFPEPEHFRSVAAYLGDNYMIFNIEKEGRVVVSLFAFLFRETVTGYYIGSEHDESIRKLKPVDLIFWEVFRWAIARHFKYFDWMGAGSPGKEYGVRDFKLQYGGELQNFGRYEKIHMPLLYMIGRTGLYFRQKLH